MKKITFTTKAKKVALGVGICLICGGVLVAALNSTNAMVEASGTSGTSTETSSEVNNVSVAPVLIVGNSSSTPSGSGTGSAFDPAKEESRSEPLTVISKPTSKPPKPVVEGDSKDGKQPTNSALTDKTKKPTYTSKPTVTSKPSSSSKSGGSTGTTGGDPIFGNKTSPKGSTTIVDGNWGEGSQVGIMD